MEILKERCYKTHFLFLHVNFDLHVFIIFHIPYKGSGVVYIWWIFYFLILSQMISCKHTT